jgi:hypothetical protein
MVENKGFNLDQQRTLSWEKFQRRSRRVLNAGFAEYAVGLGDELAVDFQADTVVRCVDEGITNGLRVAGSGIILPPEEAAVLLNDIGATGITSHELCGAAALMAGDKDPNAYAISWAQETAEIAGLPYEGHIPASELHRPKQFHDTGVIYVDETNRFAPRNDSPLPQGFVISADLPGRQDLVTAQVDTVIGIAMHHGFGEELFREEPLRVVHIEKPGDVYTDTSSLQNVANKYDGLVVVDGFQAVLPQPLQRPGESSPQHFA